MNPILLSNIFQIKNRNIFEYIITFLDQHDICNLKFITRSETLDKVYTKVKEYQQKRAKVIFVGRKYYLP